MNKKAVWVMSGFFLACVTYVFISAVPSTPEADSRIQAKIGVVDFKVCLENSKLGKLEQGRFEEIKKQMEASIEVKEKELNEMAPKFKDEYIDTLTPEAEAELKEKFRRLSQELSQNQNQYYQLLNQANFQIVQKISDWIGTASEKIAKNKNLDIVLNDEACFFVVPGYDVSLDVVKELDERFAKEEKKNPEKTEEKSEKK